jgi:thiamine-monophosphate kinase
VELLNGFLATLLEGLVITVADLGEFGVIAAIQELLPPGDALILGPGDDAAVLAVPDGRVVATTDVLVEGRHFRRDWSGPADVGVKAAAQNLADVAAMGAVPTALLVGLACPGQTRAEWVLDLVRGMADECRRAGAAIAGGDVTAADSIMLGVTALGDLAGRPPVTRAAARPGDVVALAGRIGWSAAGLALLRAGRGEAELAPLVAAHRRPQPPYPAGPAAARAGATAMIDVSDGLLADLGHIAAASAVQIDVQTAELEVGELVRTAAALLGVRWREWVLAGGEDHALAATFPAGTALPATWRAIGTVRQGGGVVVDGRSWNGSTGWDHFR